MKLKSSMTADLSRELRFTPVTFESWPYPNVCAHRGAGKLAPENTLEALKFGATLGHRMFEFDVKLSADNVAFLLHDDTLNRTTNASGFAGKRLMSELELLDAGKLMGQQVSSFNIAANHVIRIPRLHSIATWLLDNNYLANVEIKPTKGTEAQTGAQVARDCWAVWSQRLQSLPAEQLLVPPLLSSFSEVALAAARDAVPQLPRALLLDRLPNDWLDRCLALDVVALDSNFRALDAQVIELAKANRLRVLSYTINDMNVMKSLFAAGLDCAITDAVDLVMP